MDKKLYWLSVGLATLGLLVSIYMTIYKLTSNNSMCLGSGDCSTVNSSPYSEIYGIPVALFGVLGYGSILGLLLIKKQFGKFIFENKTLGIFGLAVTGFAFTLYLVYLEIYVIKAICPFCVTSQISMSILFVVTVIRLIRQPEN